MTVMKKCASSLLVQRASVYVVRRLAYYPQGTSFLDSVSCLQSLNLAPEIVCDKKYRERIEVFRSALGKEGAIEAAVAILRQYEDPDVIAGALCAIGNLVIDCTLIISLFSFHFVDISLIFVS